MKSILARLAALPFLATLLLAAAPARAEPPIWVVKDGDSTIYLFGTVHLLRPEMQWRTPRIDEAMARSTELWLEIVVPGDDEMAAIMGPLMLSKGLSLDRTLSSRMTAADKAALERAVRVANLPADTVQMIDMMKPWLVAAVLDVAPMEAAGYDSDAGVEEVLSGIATREGDRIRELESIAQQMGFLADLPDDVQMQLLRDTLENIGNIAEDDRAIAAWAAGDLAPITEEVVAMKADMPQLYAALVSRRNENWAGQIETMLKGSGTVFIAVGAGHFAGPDSVIERLKARGITAERY